MKGKIGELICAMSAYYAGQAHRINHFLKVYAYAKAIGQCEGLTDGQQEILEVAAVVHDIGIREAERKYGSCAGPYQEKEGPPIAREMLERLGYEKPLIDRVCTLVGRHHTYTNVDGRDCRILIEADFLVNLDEEGVWKKGPEPIRAVEARNFETATGKKFLKELFLSGQEN